MARTKREGKSAGAVNVDGIAGDRLKSFIERIERLEAEKKATGDDIKEVFAEAKGTGFDTKIMRMIIKERAMDKDDLDEQETMLDVYRRALGMLPLFAAAEEREEADGEPDAMRPIGKVAAQVVEQVAQQLAGAGIEVTTDPAIAEAHQQGRAAFLAGGSIIKPPKFKTDGELRAWDKGFNAEKRAKAAAEPKTADPDRQAEAKGLGETAGLAGKLHTANPYAVAHPLHNWWAKGWTVGAQALAEQGKTPDANGNGAEKVTPLRRGKAPAAPKMSPEQAAALLGGAPEGTS